MTQDDTHSDSPGQSRGCVWWFAAIGTLAVILPFAARYHRERDRVEAERLRAERRAESIDRVKRGDDSVSVLDPQLLPMLADDRDCIDNLHSLWFAMVEITPEDASYVSRLVNLRSISFYETRGADFVLTQSRHLQLEELSFVKTALSQDSLRILTELSCLKRVLLGYELEPDELAILRALPPGVTLEIGDPR